MIKKKFQTIKDWLNEQKKEDEKNSGCVMIDANMRDWEDIHRRNRSK